MNQQTYHDNFNIDEDVERSEQFQRGIYYPSAYSKFNFAGPGFFKDFIIEKFDSHLKSLIFPSNAIATPNFIVSTPYDNIQCYLFGNIFIYFSDQLDILYHKLISMDILESDRKILGHGYRWREFYKWNDEELKLLDKTLKEYVHYLNTITVILYLNKFFERKIRDLDIKANNEVFFRLFAQLRTANYWSSQTKINRKTSFIDYVGNQITYFLKFIIRWTLSKYLGQNHHTYGITAKAIIHLISEFAIDAQVFLSTEKNFRIGIVE